MRAQDLNPPPKWMTTQTQLSQQPRTATGTLPEKHQFPIFVETHRATMTQDIYRTVKWVERNPEIRFNGDFSHYYTGHEMIYGDFEKKLDFLAPVLERVRFIHGRIGDSCCMQIEVTDLEATHVKHFREFWIRSFVGFLKTARPGDYFCFAPELLASKDGVRPLLATS